jgi:hypothetical protein
MLLRACPVGIRGIAIALAGRFSTPANADTTFTETYDAGTQDVGNWILTTDPERPRVIEPTGGDPGGDLYGEVSSAIPTWATASPRYQPGLNDAA